MKLRIRRTERGDACERRAQSVDVKLLKREINSQSVRSGHSGHCHVCIRLFFKIIYKVILRRKKIKSYILTLLLIFLPNY